VRRRKPGRTPKIRRGRRRVISATSAPGASARFSSDEMAAGKLGRDAIQEPTEEAQPYPVYDFGFWEVRTPPARWCCHALALPGVLGVGGTAAGAKDSLFQKLALLEKCTKAPGERELCRHLLGTWKATADGADADFVFWEEKGIWSAVAPPIQGVYGIARPDGSRRPRDEPDSRPSRSWPTT